MFANLNEMFESKLIAFSDPAIVSLCDGISSMEPHLVLLTGVGRRCCPISWKANKTKCMVGSTIAAEAFSLQERLEDEIHVFKFLENCQDHVLMKDYSMTLLITRHYGRGYSFHENGRRQKVENRY